MKRFLLVCVILVLSFLTASSQSKIDYNTYDVIASSGNITVVAKEKDYRMIVGPIKKPTTIFLLGYTTEFAETKIERLITVCGNDKHSKKNRDISFCGIPLHYSVIGTGDAEQYSFIGDLDKVKFVLAKKDILEIQKQLENNNK